MDLDHLPCVTRVDRERLAGHRGAVVWLTGLSGAGKSTVARAVDARLLALGVRSYVLDGDDIRHGLCADLGFSIGDRRENIRRVGAVAQLFADAGVIVLAALISPLREDRDTLRATNPAGRFFEVYCSCPLEVCERRDTKGLYQKARTGQLTEFTGVSSVYEAPQAPDCVLDSSVHDIDTCVERVLNLLRQHELLG